MPTAGSFTSGPGVSTDPPDSAPTISPSARAAESGLLVMSDNWFISRYAGYNIDGNTNWSGWVGAAGGGGAQFRPGWISRVLGRRSILLTPRTSDFHTEPIDTYQSVLEQAGPRYEGPIALNANPSYINSIGLIEAYQTVLQLAKA